MKRFILPLSAALVVAVLASCANASDSGMAPLLPAVPQQPAAPAPESQAETWPQITPVNFNVDLEGFEECPKDPVYGINWVFVSKRVLDENGATAKKWLEGENIRLKPVELHKSNPNGVRFGFTALGSFHYEDGAYKCVAYRKPGDASDSLAVAGCEFHYIPDGDNGYYKTHSLNVTRVASQKTKVSNGERFREVYKY